MSKIRINNLLCNVLLLVLLALPALVFSRPIGGPEDPGNPDSLAQNPLGHLSCIIHADTNCVDHTVTLEAWASYLFTGIEEPLTAAWSTGETAHKIVVSPPGTWSWDASNVGCEPVHQFNTITMDNGFYTGTLDIIGENTSCPLNNASLIVNSQGYTAFSSFQWSPAYNQLTPRPVTQFGDYALTVTDALGCIFTDEITVQGAAGGESCDASCTSCNIDGLQGINNGTPSSDEPVCLGIVLHNDQWFGFVAGSTAITLEIEASNCQNGDGLQGAIFDQCSSLADPIVCNVGCSGCSDVLLTFEYAEYTPGETYWLMLDGYVGDVCDFTIHVTSGSTVAPTPATPAVPTGPTNVCPGAVAVYKVPPAAGAGYYHWTAPPGSSINGGSNNQLFEASSGTEVTVTFGNLGGNICVQTSNACKADTTSKCLQVTMQPIPVTVKPTLIVCNEDLPYEWDEEPYSLLAAPGTYVLNSTPYQGYLGCDSVVRQTIVVKPAIITNLSPRFLCPGDCFQIGGEEYCDQGNYSVYLESYQGCDSLVNFSIIELNPIAEIMPVAQLGCEQGASVTLTAVLTPGGKTWRNAAGQQIGAGLSVNVTQPGLYTLTTTVLGGGVQCTQTDSVFVTAAASIGDVQIAGADAGCSGNPLILQCNTGASSPSFAWSGPNGFVSSEQNPEVTALGQYSVTVTSGACTGTASATVNVIGGAPDASAENDTISCVQPIGQLNGISGSNGVSFAWTGPDGFQSADEDPAVTTPGEYLLTVTSAGGCTNTATAQLVATADIPTVEVADATIVCTVLPTLNCTTNAASPSFLWSGPGNFTATEQNPQVSETGVYTVTVTTPDGCTASASATVDYEDNAPDASAQDLVLGCGETSGQLNGNSATSGASYAWTGPNGFESAAQDPVVEIPGVYTLTVTGQEGCTKSVSVSVTSLGAVPSVAVDNASILCTTYPQLNVTTDADAPTYSWTGPDGFTSAQPNPTVSVAGPYTVIVSSGTGCTASATAFVDAVVVTPDAFATSDTITCGETEGLLTGGSATSGATFAWTGPNGFQSVDQNVFVTTIGTYQLTVSSPAGCTATATAALVVLGGSIPVEIANASIICTTLPELISTTTAADPSYVWAGPNGFTSVEAQPVAPVEGNYTLTVTDLATGCTGTASVNVLNPDFGFEIITDAVVQPNIGQNNGSISISALNFPGMVTYSWTLDGAPFSAEEDLNNLAPGTYTLVVTDSFGCSMEQSFVLEAVSATHEASDLSQWMVMPNPSTGLFELVNKTGNSTATQLRVFDVGGKLVMEQALAVSGKNAGVDLTASPAGVYLLELRDILHSTWLKLVVQR